jgi:hypothetical protein
MKAMRARMAKGMTAVRERVAGKSTEDVWLGAAVGLDAAVSASKGVHVTRVRHASPAALSGCIAVGDVICAIDAQSVGADTSAEEVLAALAGDGGTPVWLEMSHVPGGAVRMIVLLRQEPLEEPSEELVGGELGFHAEYDPLGCLVTGYVEGGAGWLAAQVCPNNPGADEKRPGDADAPWGGHGKGARIVYQGCTIVRIDGIPLGGKTPQQMQEMLRGAAFQRVALELAAPPSSPRDDGSLPPPPAARRKTWRCDVVRSSRLSAGRFRAVRRVRVYLRVLRLSTRSCIHAGRF